MAKQVTNADLRVLIAELKGDVQTYHQVLETKVDGIIARQDVANGQTAKNTDRLNEHDVKFAALAGRADFWKGVGGFLNSKVGFLIIGILGTGLLALVGANVDDVAKLIGLGK